MKAVVLENTGKIDRREEGFIKIATVPEAARKVASLADYVTLTKPRLNALVVATTNAG